MSNESKMVTIPREEYEYLKTFPELPAGYVKIREEKLKGYENALRIIHDRALQQIDKAKSDQYGYRMLDAKHIYDGYGEYRPDLRQKDIEVEVWQIRMETPHSTKIAYEDALFIIKEDLERYYAPIVNLDAECRYGALWYIFGDKFRNPKFIDCIKGIIIVIMSNEYDYIESPEREERIVQKYNHYEYTRLSMIKNEETAKLIEWTKSLGDKMIYKIVSLNPNYGTGRYEITFKCSKMI